MKIKTHSTRFTAMFLAAVLCVGWLLDAKPAYAEPPKTQEIFAKKNLVAWCIVPFDGKKRGPEARAAMLKRIGITRLAYDYRAEHVPTFDAEMKALKKHGIELTAWWFPGVLNAEAKMILDVLKRHEIKTQLWISGGGGPANAKGQEAWVKKEADRIRPIAEAAAKIGCSVGLYNHGGWFGEPENQIAIIKQLKLKNVGIVYNLHHGHGHLDRFAKLLKTMQPYLIALNLNGMTPGGDQHGDKILPIGAGESDLKVLRTILQSGYRGPIGILNHTNEDAEARLLDNLEGLEWINRQLHGKPAGERPKRRSWKPRTPAGRSAKTLFKGMLTAGKQAYRSPPITVECRATLHSSNSYNILVASDTKKSAAHWEIFSMAGNGLLTAYLPGMKPDHVHSATKVCDGKPHQIAMVYEPQRVRLFVDGRQVADQAVRSLGRPVVAGGLAVGRLVEDGFGCDGQIDWVRISKGVREIAKGSAADVKKDKATIDIWRFPKAKGASGKGAADTPNKSATAPDYSLKFVAQTVADVQQHGVAERGITVFASDKLACLSCHKIGSRGGSVGPDLTTIGKQRTAEQIIESIYWPKREVKPEFQQTSIITLDGDVVRGYIAASDKKVVVVRDPATGATTKIDRNEIDEQVPGTTLMPDGLTAAMSREQQLDLIRLLIGLGREESVSLKVVDAVLAHAHMHAPARFPWTREPIHPQQWPHWRHHVNRDRIYDYYSKQADYFRTREPMPMLLPEFPGLDGGEQGHWGNQVEATWASDGWNKTQLGSVQSGIFHGAGVTVARGVCVRLGEQDELSVCFNPDTLNYDAVWSGGFVKFSSVRHGFLHGLLLDGKPLPRPEAIKHKGPTAYRGFYRHGKRIVFSYRIGEVDYLDAPWVENGKFVRTLAPAAEHPLKHLATAGKAQWPQTTETPITLGTARPYAVDTIALPHENPWKALMYCGGHDFLPDGSALVCTMQGDVWHVSRIASKDKLSGKMSTTARWRRFASGLHHALGLVVAKDGIYVQCRDQLTRLHDLNGDGEADFYECFNHSFVTSTSGHDFICGLERDRDGNFYTVSGNQGLIRISADGGRADVMATGFRNADGLGIAADGVVTVPCSEGTWTPASMICAVRVAKDAPKEPPYFGYGGPRKGQVPELPLVYLPRNLDNSSGGQTTITSDRWGPLEGLMLHSSFGMGRHFLLLRDEVEGQMQGAIVPLPGEFISGAHRGRFNPADGQFYISGMTGWGNYALQSGCFQRVRYTGDRVQLPVGFHVYQNGVSVTFSEKIDRAAAEQAGSHFAQCWNYVYSAAYGSNEYSARHQGVRGHDSVAIRSAHVLSDGRTLFLEMPDLQPVNLLHLKLSVDATAAGAIDPSQSGRDLFVTVHKLDKPFTNFPGYRPSPKTIAAHPILADLALVTERVPNPWREPIKDAREIILATGKNLSFATRTLTVRAGEPIRLTLSNPDVVPHNWALVKPGTLRRVGEMSNLLVSDPAGFARHYIPKTSDVLVYTDVVPPKSEFSIHFLAPKTPGRYPFLCTFPGHWMVMNGEMIVD